MSKNRSSWLDRFAQNRTRTHWEAMAREATTLDLESLRALRSEARGLRRRLDKVLHVADGRLQLPLIGSDSIQRPLGCDWAWRPEAWRGPIFPQGVAGAENRTKMGAEVTLFHDCPMTELTLRQVRNTQEADLSPFGLRMDVFRFGGSFLSLVLDLPDAAVVGLKLSHLIRLNMVLELEKPLEIFCRLNVKHGPNVEQVVRELPTAGGAGSVEFDLAYTRLNEKRVEKAWVDLIFEGPQMNQIVLRDLHFLRHPRAEI